MKTPVRPKVSIYTGTSNIVFPGTRQSFPPEYQSKSRLCYYSTLLNSVEINSTFKKLPMPSTFEKWAGEAEQDFRFTLKMSKEVTHPKNLEGVDLEEIDGFFGAASRLGEKKGCILLQFPGSITIGHYSKLEDIFGRVHQVNANEWPVTVEFRHSSLYEREAFELVDEFDFSMVLHDFKKVKNQELNKKATVAYFRFHGPQGDYRGEYDERTLEQYAVKINDQIKQGKPVYAYFNNTIGNAFENAVALKKMLT